MNSAPVTNLREEIADLTSYIGGLPEDLRRGAYIAPYRGRLQALLDELASAELLATAFTAHRPAMDLRVVTRADEHRVPALFLGELLQGWQSLVSALGQAAAGRPTSRGLISSDVLRQTTLEVVAFAQGSFIARMVLEELEQTVMGSSDLGVAAFNEFEKLLAAGYDHHELTVLMQRLKGRVLSSYGHLLQLLSKNQTDLKVAFAEPSDTEIRQVFLPSFEAERVLDVLGTVGGTEEERLETVVGRLNAAHRRTRTFEIDLGDDGTITGRVAHDQLLDGLVIGNLYTFDIVQVTTRNPLTGEFESSASLVKAVPHRAGAAR